MKNILLLASNKNINNKSCITMVDYLNKKNIKFQHIDININEFKNIKHNKDTLLISFGGDGTALKAMKLAWKYKLDLLSFGPGRIGYLVNPVSKFNKFLDDWSKNIHTHVKRNPIIQNKDSQYPAFNEVVIIKNSPTKLLDLSVCTYNQKVNLRADGIIISTSLGSTAYNYSAGGPIVHNDINSLVITPISPFSKFPRSVVVSKDTNLEVTIKKNQNFAIQIDGIEEVQMNMKKDVTYEYTLSSKFINVIDDNNNPKLDQFLNQILR